MAGETRWQHRAVFVSSPFRDLHAERDYLRAVVLPQLEERLRRQHCFVEWADLRWGVETTSVADEETRELLVLKVCLAEIERSRPLFIALLGDRYGTVLDESRMRRAADEVGFAGEVAGHSVTALEIEYGALLTEELRSRTLVYFREPLPYEEMGEQAAVYSDANHPDPAVRALAPRLAALKERIRSLMPAERVRTYRAEWDAPSQRVSGLEDFGAMVLADLEGAIVKSLKESGPPPEPLEEFVAQRTRLFVGRRGLVEELEGFALGAGSGEYGAGLVLTGASGAGKSAVFGQLVRRLSGRAMVLAHAAGAGAEAGSVDGMLRRWVAELAGENGQESSPAGEELEGRFRVMLGAASQGRRVVLLVDALDQFERTTRGQHVTWLGRRLPANVRVIATAIPGSESAALLARGDFAARELGPLSEAEARELAVGLCGRYRRTPAEAVLRAVLREPGCYGSPLWLTTAVEELNLLDQDDFALTEALPGRPDERLVTRLVEVAEGFPADVAGLYRAVLERLSKRLLDAPPPAGAVLGWTWAVAATLAVGRAGWRESDLAAVAAVLTGESWDPLRFARWRRSLRAHLVERGEAGRWDCGHRALREAVVGALEESQRVAVHRALAEHLTTLPPGDPVRQAERMVHWIGTGDARRTAAEYAAPAEGPERTAASRALAERATSGAAGLEWVTGLLQVDGVADEVRAALASQFIWPLSEALSQAPLAVREAVAVAAREALTACCEREPQDARWQRGLAASHERVGDALMAKGDLAKALEAYKAGLAIVERLVARDPQNAEWQRDLSVSHDKVGDVLRAQGDLARALAAYEAARAIAERLAALDPQNAQWQRDLSVSHNKVGDVLMEQGDLARALAAYKAALAIRKRWADLDPQNAQWQRDLSVSHSKMGDVLRARGDLAGALEAYQAYLAIAERLAALDPQNAAWQRDLSGSHERVGDVLRAQGDLAGALEAYQAYLAIAERLAALDPQNAQWQRDLSVSHIKMGDVLRAQGDLAGALEAYQAYLAIAERLAALDPQNAEWQRDLAVSHDRLARVAAAQGDERRAREWWGRARDRLRAMPAAGIQLDAEARRYLAWLEQRLGGGLAPWGGGGKEKG